MIFGFGLLLALGAACSIWRARSRTSSSPSTSRIRTLARFYHERVSHFKAQVQTLDEHSNEYTSIFSGEEWNDLAKTIADLEQTDTQIQGLIVTRQFEKAAAILHELYDPTKHPLDAVQADIDIFRANTEWEATVRGMLKRVVQNLEGATDQMKQVSEPPRSKKRRPTLVTLADVKKSLLEDEVIARQRLDS